VGVRKIFQLAAILVAALLAGAAPTPAGATATSSSSRLRAIALRVSGFAVDGERWAVWQQQPSAPIEVLDVSDGHLRAVPAGGCTVKAPSEYDIALLADEDGTFLVECGKNSYAALRASSGRIQALPFGYVWVRAGAIYAESGAPTHAQGRKAQARVPRRASSPHPATLRQTGNRH
jgi:hypothetical protein